MFFLSFLKFHYEYAAGVSLSNVLFVVSGILSQGNKPVISDRTLTGVSESSSLLQERVAPGSKV
jgi:hypothetical protein